MFRARILVGRRVVFRARVMVDRRMMVGRRVSVSVSLSLVLVVDTIVTGTLFHARFSVSLGPSASAAPPASVPPRFLVSMPGGMHGIVVGKRALRGHAAY